MKEQNFTSVVVYLNNNEDHVQDFLLKVDNLMFQKFKAYEFILVNNFCQDKTMDKVEEISEKINGNINIVDLAWEHNIELAMLAGVDLAIGDFVYEFDSIIMDYNPKIIWETYQKAMKGYDIVSVSSDKPINYSSKLFYKFLNKVSYRNLSLTTETFRLLSRRALNRVLKSRERVRYRKALYKYSGFESTNIEYESINEKNPVINKSFLEKISLASDILVSFSDFGTKIALILSIFFTFVSVFAGGYTVYVYFTLENVVSGWTTTMFLLSVSFSGIFFVLAFLSKYMEVVLLEMQERPNYVYKAVEKLANKKMDK
ncbi:dolichol-phosphate mannosyltransferase [Halanaerobium congolense]|uniref:Dolichol-phosphate mannosyltransferase n=1 Tax=Halanaerobium congolense TaxID=54121 RepID=A0A1G8R2V0_9FIRM|nr:hypothetical protein [Halanaerobium congolense]SDJ10720.1 dolichol-phosphate mannosyltransferase [Halanaerobium congolense]SET65693.1 dolichol-phosphate mannosyltransferase [Halanaerobium congolense]